MDILKLVQFTLLVVTEIMKEIINEITVRIWLEKCLLSILEEKA
jgi:hypothetical protein